MYSVVKGLAKKPSGSGWHIAAGASFNATYDCVSAWLTDFRKDLAVIDVPTLVIHGDRDRICPFPVTGKRTNEMVKGSKLILLEGGPHGLNWTHANEMNRALLDFIQHDSKYKIIPE